MNHFNQIEENLSLLKFCDSKLGNFYFTPFQPKVQQWIVRRFDQNLSPDQIGVFCDFIAQIDQFVQQTPGLKDKIYIEKIEEIGHDFIRRKFHRNYQTIEDYFNKNEPVEPPEEWEELREIIRQLKVDNLSKKEQLILTVLKRSLFQSTFKTYFDEEEEQFIIYEPTFTIEDIKNWS